MQINVKVIGKDKLKRKIHQQVQALGDMTKFYRTVGRHMCDETIRDRFGNERSPDGRKWAPWSESYKRHMAQQLNGRKGKRSGKRGKLGNKILQDTGRLRRSIQFYAFPDRVVIGTNLVYARAHQFGVPKRNLPARPFMGVNDRDREWVLNALGQHIFNRRFGRGR